MNLNVREFASSVSRLIDNAENLIEFKNTILRRTLNRLNKDYDPALVHEFEIIMEDSYGMSVGKSQNDLENDFVPTYDQHAGPLE